MISKLTFAELSLKLARSCLRTFSFFLILNSSFFLLTSRIICPRDVRLKMGVDEEHCLRQSDNTRLTKAMRKRKSGHRMQTIFSKLSLVRHTCTVFSYFLIHFLTHAPSCRITLLSTAHWKSEV